MLTASALRRNVEHLTSIGERDYEEMKKLESKFDKLKSKHDASHELSIKLEKENRELRKERIDASAAAANSGPSASTSSKPRLDSDSDCDDDAPPDANVVSLQAALSEAVSRVALLSASNRRLGELRAGEALALERMEKELKAGQKARADEAARLAEACKTQSQAEAENARLVAECSTLANRLDCSEQNVAALHSRLLATSTNVDAAEFARHRQTAAALRKELDSSIPVLQAQIKRKDEEIVSLLAANARAGVQVEAARTEAGKAAAEKEMLLSNKASREREMKDLEEKLERATRGEARATEAFKREAAMRQEDCVALGRARDELEIEKAKKVQENGKADALALELEIRGMEIVRLKVELEEGGERLGAVREQLERERMKKVQQSADLTVQALQRSREAEDEAAAIIAKEKREVERLLAEANASREAVVAKMEAERVEIDEKLLHMEEVMAMMKAKEDDDESVMGQLHANLVAMTAERDELKEGLKQEIKENKTERKTMTDSMDDLSAHISASLAAHEASRKELLTLQSEAFSHAAEISKATLIAGGLRKEVEAMHDQRRRGEGELREKVVECRRLTQAVEDLEAELSVMKDKKGVDMSTHKIVERDRDLLAKRVAGFERRFKSIVQRLRDIEGDTRATIESMGGDKERENNIISWAFEKIDIDIKLLVLGDDEGREEGK